MFSREFIRLASALSLVLLTGCGLQAPPPTQAMKATFKRAWRSFSPLAESLANQSNLGVGALLEGDAIGVMPPAVAPALTSGAFAVRPPRVDLRPACPPVYHQGPFFSCTAFAVAKGLGEYLLRRKGDKTPLSAAHFYAATEQATTIVQWRVNEDNVNWYGGNIAGMADQGAPIASAMATLEMGGAVKEADSPYPPEAAWAEYNDFRRRNPRSKPQVHGDPEFEVSPTLQKYFDVPGFSLSDKSRVTYANAPTAFRIQEAQPTRDLPAIKAALARKMPVVAAFHLYEGFYSKEVRSTGKVALPAAAEQFVGAHAMLIVGYDDAKQELLVRNSWGENWGEKGYCRWPYAAVGRRLIQDAWTVSKE